MPPCSKILSIFDSKESKRLETINFLLAAGTMLSVVGVIFVIFGATLRVKPADRLKLGIIYDSSCLPRI